MHIGIISKVGIQKSLTLANDLELSLKKDHVNNHIKSNIKII